MEAPRKPPAPGYIPIPLGGPQAIRGKRTVAFMDILGFKRWIENTDVKNISGRYEEAVGDIEFLNNPRTPGPAQSSLFPDHPLDVPYCKQFIFSDSIIMISNGPGPSETLKTLICAWRTLQVFLAHRIPLRGAVAFGDMYINANRNIFLGPALTLAAELERSQEWVGAVIDHSAIKEISIFIERPDETGKFLNQIFREYPVPMKNGKSRKLYTLNWLAGIVLRDHEVKDLFKFTDDQSVDIKFSNALKYSEGAAVQAENGKVPLELGTAFIDPPPTAS